MNHIPRRILAFCLSSLATTCAFATEPAQSVPTQETSSQTTPRVAENYGKLPLSFEANQGQSDSQVKFLSRGSGYSLFLTGNEAVLALKKKPGKRASRDSHFQPAALTTRRPEPESEAVRVLPTPFA